MIFLRAAQREFANTAVAVFVALFAILISTVLIRLLGQAAGGRLASDAVLALIGFGSIAQLPIVLTLTLFIAILTTLSRSYRDSEMVVWFASGVPLTAWVKPVLYFTLPLVVVIAATTLVVAPWAQLKTVEFRIRSNDRDDAARVAPGVFRESAGGQRVFFVETGAGEDGRVKNVFVNTRQHGRLGIMVSSEGYLKTDEDGARFVVLENGRRYEGSPGTPDYRVMEFRRYAVRIESPATRALPQKPRMLSTGRLIGDPLPAYRGELAARIGTPVAAFLLALLAIPMSFVNPRAGRTNNLIAALLVYLIYTNALSISQAWITQSKIGFTTGLWAPHVAMVALLIVLFGRRLSLISIWRKQVA